MSKVGFKTKDWNGEKITYLNDGKESWFAVAPLCKVLEYKGRNYDRILGSANVDPKNVLKLAKSGLFKCEAKFVRDNVDDESKILVVATDKQVASEATCLFNIINDNDKLYLELSSNGKGGLIVNTQGYHQLLAASTMPKAKKFHKWVVDEIVTKYDKHGAVFETDDTDKEMTGLLINERRPVVGIEKDKLLKKYNSRKPDTYTTTEIGKRLGWTARLVNKTLAELDISFKKHKHLTKSKYDFLAKSGDWTIVNKTPYFTQNGMLEVLKIIENSTKFKEIELEKEEFISKSLIFVGKCAVVKLYIKKGEGDVNEVKSAYESIRKEYSLMKKGIKNYNLETRDHYHLREALHYISDSSVKKKMDLLVFGKSKSKKKKSGKDDFKDLMSIIRSGKKLKATQKDDGTISIFM